MTLRHRLFLAVTLPLWGAVLATFHLYDALRRRRWLRLHPDLRRVPPARTSTAL